MNKRQKQLTQPTIKIRFSDETYKYWTKQLGRVLLKGLTIKLDEKTKELGRACGEVYITYLKDPDGDYYTKFSFHDKADCLEKIKPAIEKQLLDYIYDKTIS